jgi:putative heme-binding domain-containing protein
VKLLRSDSVALAAAAARAAGAWGVKAARPELLDLARAKGTSAGLRQAAIDGLAALGGKASAAALDRLAADGERAALLALVSLDAEAAARRAAEALASAKTGEGAEEVVTAFLRRKGGPAALAEALAGAKLPSDAARVGLRAVRSSGLEAKDLTEALTKAGGLTGGPRKLSAEQVKQLTADVARRGDAARGEAVFRRRDQLCLGCHAVGGAGGQVGPDLASIGASAQVDYLIDSLLEPSKAIKEGFHTLRVSTTKGVTLTGVKVRETKEELVLRTAEDRLVAVPAKDIDEQEVLKTSLMPEGLTDPLTEGELRDLVRFLSELGKTGPYTVGRARAARRWQALEATSEAVRRLAAEGPGAAVADEPGLAWAPAYSTVAGELPLDGLPRMAAGEGKAVAAVRCQVEVSTGGAVRLRLNSARGLRLWIGRKPVDAAAEVELTLPAGTHTLTFAMDLSARSEGLRCELDDAPGSKAQARFVGGK